MADWGDINTDAAWDPWLLKQIRATLEGHENGEACAINATTIDDAGRSAATWRNLGGAGAGSWLAADGSGIGAAHDTGWVFLKPFTAAGASFSGSVAIAGSLDVDGPFTGSSGAFSGDVDIGGTLNVDEVAEFGSSVVVNGPFFANDAATLGTNSADALSVNATSVFLSPVTIQGSQGLRLRNTASSGSWYFNPTNAADPSLELKDTSGDTMLTLSPSGSTYALTTTGDLSVNDVVASGQVAAQGLSSSSGLTLTGPSNIDGNGGTAGQLRIGGVIVNQAAFDATEKLLVNGTSRLKGAVEVTTGSLTVTAGGISAGASSSFTGGVSVVSGGVSVIAGGVDAGAMTSTPAANVGYAPAFVKGWTYFDPAAVSGHTSYNVGSITDNGDGNWTVNWARAFADASYAVVAMAAMSWDGSVASQRLAQEYHGTRTASSTHILCLRPDTAVRTDPDRMSVMACGRQ